jgi:hypothetical protein
VIPQKSVFENVNGETQIKLEKAALSPSRLVLPLTWALTSMPTSNRGSSLQNWKTRTGKSVWQSPGLPRECLVVCFLTRCFGPHRVIPPQRTQKCPGLLIGGCSQVVESESPPPNSVPGSLPPLCPSHHFFLHSTS